MGEEKIKGRYSLSVSRPLRAGLNKGKCIYTVFDDGNKVLQTKPITAEESLHLRRLLKDERKTQEYIEIMKRNEV